MSLIALPVFLPTKGCFPDTPWRGVEHEDIGFDGEFFLFSRCVDGTFGL